MVNSSEWYNSGNGIKMPGGAANTPGLAPRRDPEMRPKLTPGLLSSFRLSSDYPHGITPSERFWRQVRDADERGCRNWSGANNGVGYGVFNVDGQMYLATHVAWVLAGEDLGEEPNICHHCDNPSCVNPYHLFLGTRYDNMQDALLKGRMKTPFGPGEGNQNSILSEPDIRLIRRLHVERPSNQTTSEFCREHADRFGVRARTIEGVVGGRSWKHVR